jgi:hypothetical protein
MRAFANIVATAQFTGNLLDLISFAPFPGGRPDVCGWLQVPPVDTHSSLTASRRHKGDVEDNLSSVTLPSG